jgi:hypothetical protein
MAVIAPSDSTLLHQLVTSQTSYIQIIVPAVAALLGVLLSQGIEWLRRRSETAATERRWFADHFLDHKLELLRRLHTILYDWNHSVWLYGNRSVEGFDLDELRRNMFVHEDDFQKAVLLAHMYLDESDMKALNEASEVLRLSGQVIYLRMRAHHGEGPEMTGPLADIDWLRKSSAYVGAVEALKRHLSPAILRELPR